MFVLSGLCGGKSRMLLFDQDEVISILGTVKTIVLEEEYF
jgi:hypothetical protein